MSKIVAEERELRLRMLRNSELDLLIAIEDHERKVSTSLDSACASRVQLRAVRREIRELEAERP